MATQIPGLHHVTAIAGDARRNVSFYTDVLGLRLVKKTVNFDSPETYHLYYGDDLGRPGTIMTFFPFAGARRGRPGTGQTTATAFSVPAEALGYWSDRLNKYGITAEAPLARLDEEALSFADPDGLPLELVARAGMDERPGRESGTVPRRHAIRGFHGVTLSVRDDGPTSRLLTEVMGFIIVGQDGPRVRYATGDGGPGAWVDVVGMPDGSPGIGGSGTIHHIAWRTPDEAQQLGWREDLIERGLQVTPVRDRQYFRSIYFHEPGGVLFEIATDPPGFSVDEPPKSLGTHLKLPPWLEGHRAQIEAALPALDDSVTAARR